MLTQPQKDKTLGDVYSRMKSSFPEAVEESKKATVQLVARQYLSEK